MNIKQKTITILKIIAKFILLVLIWSSGIAILDYFTEPIEALKKPTSSFIYEFFPLVFILIPSVLLWRFLDKEKISELGFSTTHFLKNNFVGFIIGFLWISLSILGVYITCTVTSNFNLKIGVDLLAIYFVILLINTIMQETLCRGYLYKLIEKPFGGNYAVLFTSIFFVLLHPGAIAAGIVGIVNVFCAGLVFGFTRKITGSLWMPIAIHITWNFIDSVLLGTSPLGLYPHLDLILVEGKDLYTGGKDGLGASLVVIFTFPILFLIFYYDVFRIKNNNKI
jgi:uncharacterized protein